MKTQERPKRGPEVDDILRRLKATHASMLATATHVFATGDKPEKPIKDEDPDKEKKWAISNMNYDGRAKKIIDIQADPNDNYKMPAVIIQKEYLSFRDGAFGGEHMLTDRSPESDMDFYDALRALPDDVTKVDLTKIDELEQLIPSFWGDEDNPDDERGIYDGSDSSRDEGGNCADEFIMFLRIYDLAGRTFGHEQLELFILSEIFTPNTINWDYDTQFWIIKWLLYDLQHHYDKDYYVSKDDSVHIKVLYEVMLLDLDVYFHA